MLSAVCLGPVIIGKVGCGANASMCLAPPDNVAACAAPARVELAGAWAVGVVGVAPVVVLVGLAGEHIFGSFEGCELGSPVLELDAELSQS